MFEYWENTQLYLSTKHSMYNTNQLTTINIVESKIRILPFIYRPHIIELTSDWFDKLFHSTKLFDIISMLFFYLVMSCVFFDLRCEFLLEPTFCALHNCQNWQLTWHWLSKWVEKTMNRRPNKTRNQEMRLCTNKRTKQ